MIRGMDYQAILQSAREQQAFLVATRRDLHQHPELGNAETRTAQVVADELERLGVEVETRVGGTGVVGTIRGTGPGKTIALRADMDALPIQETGECEFRSCNPGVMHACGHDAHTAMLLGAARLLTERRDTFPGSVKLFFQPAEETIGGANEMIDEGCMNGVDAVFGIHVWPDMPPGTVGIRSGAIMASADTIAITVEGRGGHASEPHNAIDPVPVAAQLITNLQLMVTRRFDAKEPVVVSICFVQAGSAHNVIPDRVQLAGTVRTVNPQVRERVQEEIEHTIKHTCATFGASYDFTCVPGTGVVMNDAGFSSFVGAVGDRLFGGGSVRWLPYAIMGAEDFGAFTRVAPGAFCFLGAAPADKPAYPCHHPQFDLNEDALPLGASLHVATALEFLTGE